MGFYFSLRRQQAAKVVDRDCSDSVGVDGEVHIVGRDDDGVWDRRIMRRVEREGGGDIDDVPDCPVRLAGGGSANLLRTVKTWLAEDRRSRDLQVMDFREL